MAPEISRRNALLGLTVATLAALATPVAAGDDRTIETADRTDLDDNSVNAIIGRLGSVVRVLGATNSRLDDINAVLGTAPDDGKPEILAAVDAIIFELETAMSTVLEIEATVLR